MHDVKVAGFIAGIIGGILMSIQDYIAVFLLQIEQELYLEWGSVMIFGRLPENLAEMAFGQLAHAFFAGFLGIAFAYIVRNNMNRYLIRGVVFGVFSWFAIYSLSLMFRLPALTTHTFNATVSNLTGSITYGLVTAESFRRLAVFEVR